jgi:hypothetical protein
VSPNGRNSLTLVYFSAVFATKSYKRKKRNCDVVTPLGATKFFATLLRSGSRREPSRFRLLVPSRLWT